MYQSDRSDRLPHLQLGEGAILGAASGKSILTYVCTYVYKVLPFRIP